MDQLAGPLSELIGELEKLPTVGPKTAARLAYFLLNASREDVHKLADAIRAVKDKVRFCKRCYGLADGEFCSICSDARRDQSIVCVVGEAKDVFAIERTASYRGRYHVLGGVIAPMEGVGAGQLKVKELVERIGPEGIQEVVIATNPTAEGESTALYVARVLQPVGVKVTRLALGLPIGSDLDYADETTLARALEGRRPLT